MPEVHNALTDLKKDNHIIKTQDTMPSIGIGCLNECEFPAFNGRPLRPLQNASGSRAGKAAWIGTNL